MELATSQKCILQIPKWNDEGWRFAISRNRPRKTSEYIYIQSAPSASLPLRRCVTPPVPSLPNLTALSLSLTSKKKQRNEQEYSRNTSHTYVTQASRRKNEYYKFTRKKNYKRKKQSETAQSVTAKRSSPIRFGSVFADFSSGDFSAGEAPRRRRWRRRRRCVSRRARIWSRRFPPGRAGRSVCFSRFTRRVQPRISSFSSAHATDGVSDSADAFSSRVAAILREPASSQYARAPLARVALVVVAARASPTRKPLALNTVGRFQTRALSRRFYILEQFGAHTLLSFNFANCYKTLLILTLIEWHHLRSLSSNGPLTFLSFLPIRRLTKRLMARREKSKFFYKLDASFRHNFSLSLSLSF